ncbi:MAG TPA: hypothetical protein DDW49_07010 [Deltaproteobacteria bacterium]|nr:MAG: hypothetical protein A2048_10145 [Deltaproteobacteria bacterium GWA2_45_12]HBF13120.1 hypothetical protein [Deltaproteobacteria bacterium]
MAIFRTNNVLPFRPSVRPVGWGPFPRVRGTKPGASLRPHLSPSSSPADLQPPQPVSRSRENRRLAVGAPSDGRDEFVLKGQQLPSLREDGVRALFPEMASNDGSGRRTTNPGYRLQTPFRHHVAQDSGGSARAVPPPPAPEPPPAIVPAAVPPSEEMPAIFEAGVFRTFMNEGFSVEVNHGQEGQYRLHNQYKLQGSVYFDEVTITYHVWGLPIEVKRGDT